MVGLHIAHFRVFLIKNYLLFTAFQEEWMSMRKKGFVIWKVMVHPMMVLLLLCGVQGQVHMGRFRPALMPQSSFCLDPGTEEKSKTICSLTCQFNAAGNQCAAYTFNATTSSCQCGLVLSLAQKLDVNTSSSSANDIMVNSKCPEGKFSKSQGAFPNKFPIIIWFGKDSQGLPYLLNLWLFNTTVS